jgi:hypothetical protein
MKKLFAVAILGIAALALTTESASAGWLCHHCCKSKSCLTLTAKQYNAFSPYCLDSFNGCFPLQGMGCNGNCYMGCVGGSCTQAGVACLGELPSPGAVTNLPQGGTVMAAPTMVQNGNAAPAAPKAAVQPWPTWAPGMASPSGVPSYFPGYGGLGQSYNAGR